MAALIASGTPAGKARCRSKLAAVKSKVEAKEVIVPELKNSAQRQWLGRRIASGATNGNSIVTVDRGIGNDFDQLHHAAIFVRQDVAVEHILPGEVGKASPHCEEAGDDFSSTHLLLC